MADELNTLNQIEIGGETYKAWTTKEDLPTDYAQQGSDSTATNTAIKALLVVVQGLIGQSTDDRTAATLFGKLAAVIYAVGNIDFSALAKESTLNTVKALIGEATDASTAATLFGKLAAVLSAVGNIDFSTLAKQEQLLWLNQFWGITGATEFTAATDEEIEDELDDIWAEITGEESSES